MLINALSGTSLSRSQNIQCRTVSSRHPAATVTSICKGVRLKPSSVQPRIAYAVRMPAKGRRGSFLHGTSQTAGRWAVAVGTTAPIPAATLITLESMAETVPSPYQFLRQGISNILGSAFTTAQTFLSQHVDFARLAAVPRLFL